MKENNNGYEKPMLAILILFIVVSVLLIATQLFGPTVTEWVSPDGIHYWQVNNGMSPRYDSNGELVIEADGGQLIK